MWTGKAKAACLSGWKFPHDKTSHGGIESSTGGQHARGTELLQAVRKSAAQSDARTACWVFDQRACAAAIRLRMLCSMMGASRLPVMA